MTDSLKRKILLLIGVLGLFIGALFFVVSPTLANISQNKKILSEKQVELKTLSSKVDTLQNITKHPEEFKTINDTVTNYWPDNQDISKYIVQTEGLATAKNSVLENFSVTPQSSTKKKNDNKKVLAYQTFDSVQFSFSVKSHYTTVKEIIESMESLARYNTLSSINLILNEDGLINASFIGNIFYGK